MRPVLATLPSPLVLTDAERALIVRARARHDLSAVAAPDLPQTAAIDAAVDALSTLMLAEGFHGEWQPTPLGREIEALIDKLDALRDDFAAA